MNLLLNTHRRLSIASLAIVVSAALVPGVASAAFTPGSLAILQADASTSNTTFSILELSASAFNASPMSSYAISGTGANAMRISGTATSTGYLSLSNDRSLLTFNGANSTNTSANVNTLNPRGVGTLDKNGAFVLQTTYTGASGSQTRSATSLDNTNWFIADQGGLFTNGSTTASPTGNFRKVHAFGGTVYGMTASASAAPVGTFSSFTGGAYSGLTGLSNGSSSYQDFYLIQSGVNGSTYDMLYTLSMTSATVGSIGKYSLVNGTWVANGSYATAFGGFGLAASVDGNGSDLFVTTGTGATTANSLLRIMDTAGYNSTINVNTANNLTLFTAGAGKIIKGVDFAPVPEPATMTAIGMGLVALLLRRRKR